MKQMNKYFFRLLAFMALIITPVIAYAQETGLGESINKFINDTGFAALNGNWLSLVMIAFSCLLLYLAIVKKFEPLLLLPIAFGMLLTNLPGAGLFHSELFAGGHVHWESFKDANNVGLLDYLYLGVKLGIYPCIIFIGVGAMTDFGPLLANPKSFLLGAAAQLGIFVTFLGALVLGFDYAQAGSIGIIGGADGPTAIYLTCTHCFVYLKNAMSNVPATIRARPRQAFLDSFSLKTKYENTTVTSMLSLSMGTTTLTMPFCRA